MDAPTDEPTVPPTLPDPPPTVPTQCKGRYMMPSQNTSYYHLVINDKDYSNAVITTASDEIYATAVCHIGSMALTNHEKGFVNTTNVLTSYSLAINEMIEFNNLDDGYNSFVQHMLLSQMGVNKGIKVFGQNFIDTVSKEMQKFNDREVIIPKNPSQLTKEERHRDLTYLMLLKDKCDSTIKRRGCADGRRQRIYMAKDQTSSPTISNEARFLTLTIDAREGRDVAMCDIPGAFLQTDIPEGSDKVHIKIDGAMVELLDKINPQLYQKHFFLSRKRKPVLYGEARKAIYGTLNASLLFYKNLVKSLQDWGFGINPYD